MLMNLTCIWFSSVEIVLYWDCWSGLGYSRMLWWSKINTTQMRGTQSMVKVCFLNDHLPSHESSDMPLSLPPSGMVTRSSHSKLLATFIYLYLICFLLSLRNATLVGTPSSSDSFLLTPASTTAETSKSSGAPLDALTWTECLSYEAPGWTKTTKLVYDCTTHALIMHDSCKICTSRAAISNHAKFMQSS